MLIEGGGTPSPSHNTSTGHMSFPGGTPVTGPRSLPRGTSVLAGDTPVPGRGTIMGYSPGQDGVSPSQVRIGYPLSQDRMGYSLWSGQDGEPPFRSAQDGVPPGICYAWTGYAAGDTPPAVSHRRTVLFIKIV